MLTVDAETATSVCFGAPQFLIRVFPTVEKRMQSSDQTCVLARKDNQHRKRTDWAPIPPENHFRELFLEQILKPSLRRSDDWRWVDGVDSMKKHVGETCSDPPVV